MEIVYKLTDSKMRTRPGQYNETLWGENVTHEAPGTKEMCGPGWIHAYTDPNLASLLNITHADFDQKTMILWECEAEVGIRRPDKIGCTRLTTLRQIPIPVFTTTQHQAFAILVAKQVYKDADFQKWSDNWLNGTDRSIPAAYAAYAAAYATNAAAYAANLDLVTIAKEALKY